MQNENVTTQSLEESIRQRPENLLASNASVDEERMVVGCNRHSSHVDEKEVTHPFLCYETFPSSPLFGHMFLEVLTNAVDNCGKSRAKGIEPGVVDVVASSNGTICVKNGGLPISCDFIAEHGMYNPQLALFTLLSSTNYNQSDSGRTTAGRNGVGGSSVSLFTRRTHIHAINAVTHVEYEQEALDRMRVVKEPLVKRIPSAVVESSFSFTYEVDFPSVFRDSEMVELHPANLRWMARMCMEAAASSGEVVRFNGDAYSFPTLKPFCDLITRARNPDAVVSDNFIELAFGEFDARCLIYDTPGCGAQMGYVNGIPNPLGGAHVDAVAKKVLEAARKVPKLAKVTLSSALRHISILIVCKVPSVLVSFDGQRKERLVCPSFKLGWTKSNLSALQAVERWDAVGSLLSAMTAKLYKDVDGKKQFFANVSKNCIEARCAGGEDSYKCILNVVEGDSTIDSVIKGINSDYEGVYALGGKILNTSKCNDPSKDEDECINRKVASKRIGYLIKILGLRIGMDYTSAKNMATLRYHRMRLLTDEDVDGYHIQGLILNMIRDMFPSLMLRDFIVVGSTPLIRLVGVKKEWRDAHFYSVGAYEEWRDQHPGVKHDIRYLKGLGSNNDNEVVFAFKAMKDQRYEWDELADTFMALAFDAKQEDNRKAWIAGYDRSRYETATKPDSISRFANTKLMSFNMAVVARAIPSICDGLKPTQRKILHTALSLPQNAQMLPSLSFVGKVMDLTCYHHGDQALYQTVAGMISSYMGVNNYPLICGEGQFGTIASAKPAAPRYTSSGNSPNNAKFFSHEDDVLIEYERDGLKQIEPKHYYPIVPLFALNGGSAIAVGWSTDYPPHRWDNIRHWIKVWMHNRLEPSNPIGYPTLKPWYRDYKGEVRVGGDNNDYWVTEGRFLHNPKQDITEVVMFPVGLTCKAYCKKLDKKASKYQEEKLGKLEYKMVVKKHQEANGTLSVAPNFIIKGFKQPGVKALGLRSRVSDTNIKLLTEDGRVRAFDSVHDALLYWCDWRLKGYERRKRLQLERLETQLREIRTKQRFVHSVLDGGIDIGEFRGMSGQQTKSFLMERGYPEDFMDMKLSSLTKESLERMNEKETSILKKLDYYARNSALRVWMDEIDAVRL